MNWWEAFRYVISGSNNWHFAMKEARYEAAVTGLRMRVSAPRMGDGGWAYYISPAVPGSYARVA